MTTIQEVQAKYQQLCTILGDIEVKMQGLANQKATVLKKLAELDDQAAIIKQIEDRHNASQKP